MLQAHVTWKEPQPTNTINNNNNHAARTREPFHPYRAMGCRAVPCRYIPSSRRHLPSRGSNINMSHTWHIISGRYYVRYRVAFTCLARLFLTVPTRMYDVQYRFVFDEEASYVSRGGVGCGGVASPGLPYLAMEINQHPMEPWNDGYSPLQTFASLLLVNFGDTPCPFCNRKHLQEGRTGTLSLSWLRQSVRASCGKEGRHYLSMRYLIVQSAQRHRNNQHP